MSSADPHKTEGHCPSLKSKPNLITYIIDAAVKQPTGSQPIQYNPRVICAVIGNWVQAVIWLGGRGAAKKKFTKVTYICRSAKKKVVTCFILFLILFLFFIDFF
jgi:hypothetical protein